MNTTTVETTLQQGDEGFFDNIKPRPRYWKFDARVLTLSHYEGDRLRYEIDLERLHTPLDVLEYLASVSKKGWCNQEILADLIRQLSGRLRTNRRKRSRSGPKRGCKEYTPAQLRQLAQKFMARQDRDRRAPEADGSREEDL